MDAVPTDLPLELFLRAVETSSDAILITTAGLDEPEPIIRYVNPAFESMTGWTKEEAIGQSPRILQGPKTERALLDQTRANMAKGGSFQGHTINYRKDGSEYRVEWTISPAFDAQGKVSYWVATQRDLTQLNRHTEELEQRVAERTRELEGFLYTVSHDFRAPLRAIMSASMILIEDYGDQIDREGQNELKRQSMAAKKLGTLMDDLLRLSRLTRQEMKTERIDFTTLCHEVIGDVCARLPEKPDVSVAEGLTVEGDPSLLRLVIQNFLENSVKFAKPGEPAQIDIGADGGAIFVRDQGIGFPQEKAEVIFGPFERLHTEAEYPGTGVGLANVKRIVDRHGGRVWAEGYPGEGATFWFKLG